MARQIVRTKIRLYDRNGLGMKILAYPAGSEVPLVEYERLRALSFNGAAVAPVPMSRSRADDVPPAIVAPETPTTEDEADHETPAMSRRKARSGARGRRARARTAKRRTSAPVAESIPELGDREPQREPLDYAAMTRAQLLVEAKSRGLTVGPRTSKDELVELLSKADR